MLRTLGLLITGIVVLGGCATSAPSLSVSPRDVSGTSCASLSIAPAMSSRPLPLAIPSSMLSSLDHPDTPDGLSSKARQIAEIIGILELIRKTQALEAEDRLLQGGTNQRLFELRHDLSDRMMTTFFQVSAVANQIDCEAIRANHVANTLTEVRDQRARRYEVTAIVGDALIGIVGGAFTLAAKEIAAGVAEVVGGSFATGFGLASGLAGGEHEFRDPQNFLRELWEAPPAPTVFPAIVWRFLNWPLLEGAEYPTKRDELIAEWRDDGFITQPGTMDRRTTLLFGKGGIYEIEDLRVRAQMLEELKTYVNVMVQQLHLLSQEILNSRQVATR
ncbi:MAG: hypothetical protein ABI618_20815 [Nitrospirota bacterium]